MCIRDRVPAACLQAVLYIPQRAADHPQGDLLFPFLQIDPVNPVAAVQGRGLPAPGIGEGQLVGLSEGNLPVHQQLPVDHQAVAGGLQKPGVDLIIAGLGHLNLPGQVLTAVLPPVAADGVEADLGICEGIGGGVGIVLPADGPVGAVGRLFRVQVQVFPRIIRGVVPGEILFIGCLLYTSRCV